MSFSVNTNNGAAIALQYLTATQDQLTRVQSAINSGLKKKKMETIVVLSEIDWQNKKTASGEAAGSAAMQDADDILGNID